MEDVHENDEKEVVTTLETAHVKIDLQSILTIAISVIMILVVIFVFRQELVNDNKLILDNIKIVQQRIDHIELKVEKGFNLQEDRKD